MKVKQIATGRNVLPAATSARQRPCGQRVTPVAAARWKEVSFISILNISLLCPPHCLNIGKLQVSIFYNKSTPDIRARKKILHAASAVYNMYRTLFGAQSIVDELHILGLFVNRHRDYSVSHQNGCIHNDR
jgi:hypothetical protein